MLTSSNCAVSRAVQDFVHQPTQTHNASCLAMSSKRPIIIIIINNTIIMVGSDGGIT